MTRRVKPQDRLTALRRRRDYLNQRIAGSREDLSFDKEERAALTWAINELESLYPVQEHKVGYGAKPDARPIGDQRREMWDMQDRLTAPREQG